MKEKLVIKNVIVTVEVCFIILRNSDGEQNIFDSFYIYMKFAQFSWMLGDAIDANISYEL